MNHSSDNPPANSLDDGLTDNTLRDAVLRSGYPLQNVVTRTLVESFDVVEEWGYVDRDSDDHRSLDVHAYRSLASPNSTFFDPALTLLIECKRSDLPYVFFEAAVLRTPLDFPRVFGFGPGGFALLDELRSGSRELEPAAFMGLHEFDFIGRGPPICNAFTRAERRGKNLDLSGHVPFNTVILPLVSALHHWASMMVPFARQDKYYPTLSLCICVLDAPMILAAGAETNPALTLRPWIRVVRQESFKDHVWTRYRHYVVDFVHKAFVDQFISDHVIPFADAFAERLLANEALLKGAKASVKDWDNWTFSDLKPV